MGNISSINFKGVKSNSKAHNEREKEYNYTRSDLEHKNENEKWETKWNAPDDDKKGIVFSSEIEERKKQIKKFSKDKSGRAMRSDAKPIREGVINMKSETTMEDLKKVAAHLEEKFHIKCFQIHIHRDEGRWVDKNGYKVETDTPEEQPKDAVEWQPNLHAHMQFDWQNREKEYTYKEKKKGVVITKQVKVGNNHRLTPIQLSQIQTDVALILKMERGKERVNNKPQNERQEAVAYKLQQDRAALVKIQKETQELEAKKLKLSREIEQLESNTKTLKQNTKNLRPASETLAKRVTTSLLKSKKNQREQLNGLRREYKETQKSLVLYQMYTGNAKHLTRKLEISKESLQEPQTFTQSMLESGYKPQPKKEIKRQRGRSNDKGFSR